MTQQSNGLRFDVYERVSLPEEVAAISELEEIELVPRIQVVQQGEQVLLQGQLLLNGVYRAEEPYNLTQPLEHRIPVEITLPMNRVSRLDDISVEIENFDVDLLSARTLNITGVLSLIGINVASADEAQQEWKEEPFTVVHRLDPEALAEAERLNAAEGYSYNTAESGDYSVVESYNYDYNAAESNNYNPVESSNYRIEPYWETPGQNVGAQQFEYASESQPGNETNSNPYNTYSPSVEEEYANINSVARAAEEYAPVTNSGYEAEPAQAWGAEYGYEAGSDEGYSEAEAYDALRQEPAADRTISWQSSEQVQQPAYEQPDFGSQDQQAEVEAAQDDWQPSAVEPALAFQPRREADNGWGLLSGGQVPQQSKSEEREELNRFPDAEAVNVIDLEAEGAKSGSVADVLAEDEQLAPYAIEAHTFADEIPAALEKPDLKIAVGAKRQPKASEAAEPVEAGITTTLLNSARRDQRLRQEQELAELSTAQQIEAAVEEETEWKAIFLGRNSDVEHFQKLRICIVQREETLDLIAERYQLSPREIATHNRLLDHGVNEGQVLYIP